MTPLESVAILLVSIALGWPLGRWMERALESYVARLERRD